MEIENIYSRAHYKNRLKKILNFHHDDLLYTVKKLKVLCKTIKDIFTSINKTTKAFLKNSQSEIFI